MRNLVLPIALPLLVIAAISSLGELRSEIVLQKVLNESSLNDPSLRARTHGGLITTSEREREIAEATRAAEGTFSNSEAALHLSKVYREIAADEKDQNSRIDNYCKSLSALGRALKYEPFRATYLVNWANTRQLLGRVVCKEEFTQGDFRSVSSLALKEDPTNVKVIYAAALVSLWAGDKDNALRLLNKALTFDVTISQAQETLIDSVIRSPEDLLAVVPKRFPQASRWSQLIRFSDPVRYKSMRAALGEIQTRAIELSGSEYDRGEIPGSLHLQRLLSIFGIESSGAAHKVLDEELGRYLARNGQKPAGDYLDARSKLNELEIVRATIESDTRPAKSSLSGWGKGEKVAFDEFYRSVGFFLPEGQKVSLVQILGGIPAPTLPAQSVQLFVSDDNESWTEVTHGLEIFQYQVGGRPLVALRVREGDHRYWKIHFSSGERRVSLSASLDLLIRAFGVDGRGKGSY